MTTVEETEIDAALEQLAAKNEFISNSEPMKSFESHGEEGQRLLKEIYRSVYDTTDEFVDYFSLVLITSRFLEDRICYSIFMELDRAVKIPLIDAIWSIGIDELNAYLIASRLAGHPKPFFSERDPLNTPAFYADIRNSESELFADLGSEDFQNAYISYSVKTESYAITTTLYVLRIAFGENAVTDILQRCINSEYFPSDTKLVSLLCGYEELKEYPLEWMITVVEEFGALAQLMKLEEVS